ncbi:hypothetical protein Taro_051887 [Colocasia esculenta]|uniref:D-isomer specific 2-hydroxyacid dehydrogenase NAD-binding domain-containing protein n=1 Tax=Colocasia esculenta TaxID=4460 RepID=A0A843XHR6_COLES|nr:hypothetical protein [Colocasia esculenta]
MADLRAFCITSRLVVLLSKFERFLPKNEFFTTITLMDNNSKRAEKMVENSDNHVTRVLFCGPYFPASQNYTREYVAHLPYIQVDETSLEDVPDVIGNYDICVVKNRRVDSEVIAKANRMKLMMQYGVGLDGNFHPTNIHHQDYDVGVDVEAATRHGIKVARIPGSVTGNSASCAEMAIYLMLGLLRKQVFILGFGAIGVDLAKRLRPFGVKIIATKRRWAMDLGSDGIDGLIDEKGGPDNLCEFAAEADIVVTSLTLNAETVILIPLCYLYSFFLFPEEYHLFMIMQAGIVDSKFLSSMKKGALLVNIARGPLLDYKSVASHLESGHLGGLGIDVAWQEPFDPEDPILKFPNVLITPHVAGVTEYSYRTMAKVVGDCAVQIHTGVPVTGVEFVN